MARSFGESFATAFTPAWRESYKLTSAELADEEKERKRKKGLRRVSKAKHDAIVKAADPRDVSAVADSMGAPSEEYGEKGKFEGWRKREPDAIEPTERLNRAIKASGKKIEQEAMRAVIANKLSSASARRMGKEDIKEARDYDWNTYVKKFDKQEEARMSAEDRALRKQLDTEVRANDRWAEQNEVMNTDWYNKNAFTRGMNLKDAKKEVLNQSMRRAAYNYFSKNPDAKTKSFKEGRGLGPEMLRTIKSEAKYAPTILDTAKKKAEAGKEVGRGSAAYKSIQKRHDSLIRNTYNLADRKAFPTFKERSPEASDEIADRGKGFYAAANDLIRAGGMWTFDDDVTTLSNKLRKLEQPKVYSPEEAGERAGIAGAAQAQTMSIKRYISAYGDVPFINVRDKDDNFFTQFKPGSRPSDALRKKAFDNLKQKQGFVWDEKIKAWVLPDDLED